MKRDMDLIRKILFELEKQEHGFAPWDLQVKGYSEEQIEFHVYLMGEAGLLEVVSTSHAGNSPSPSPSAKPLNITWEGYDFLEAARNDTRWDKAKNLMSQAGVGFTLELLKEVLLNLARKTLGI